MLPYRVAVLPPHPATLPVSPPCPPRASVARPRPQAAAVDRKTAEDALFNLKVSRQRHSEQQLTLARQRKSVSEQRLDANRTILRARNADAEFSRRLATMGRAPMAPLVAPRPWHSGYPSTLGKENSAAVAPALDPSQPWQSALATALGKEDIGSLGAPAPMGRSTMGAGGGVPLYSGVARGESPASVSRATNREALRNQLLQWQNEQAADSQFLHRQSLFLTRNVAPPGATGPAAGPSAAAAAARVGLQGTSTMSQFSMLRSLDGMSALNSAAK